MVEQGNPADAIAAIQELVALQADLVARPIPGRKGGRMDRAALLLGLNSHAHALGSATLYLWGIENAWVATGPVARSVYECGLLAQWILHEPGSVRSVLAEAERQRRNLADTLEKTHMREHAQPIRETLTGAIASNLQPGKIQWLTEQFALGDETYSYYRMLCAFTHAGLQVADQWLMLRPDTPAGVALARTLPPEGEMAILVAAGMLLTASAVGDDLKPGPNYQNHLNRVSNRLGIARRLARAPQQPASPNGTQDD